MRTRHQVPDQLVAVEVLMLRARAARDQVREVQLVARARGTEDGVADAEEERVDHHLGGERARLPGDAADVLRAIAEEDLDRGVQVAHRRIGGLDVAVDLGVDRGERCGRRSDPRRSRHRPRAARGRRPRRAPSRKAASAGPCRTSNHPNRLRANRYHSCARSLAGTGSPAIPNGWRAVNGVAHPGPSLRDVAAPAPGRDGRRTPWDRSRARGPHRARRSRHAPARRGCARAASCPRRHRTRRR